MYIHVWGETMQSSMLNTQHKALLQEQIIAPGEAGESLQNLQLCRMDWDTLRLHGLGFQRVVFQENRFYCTEIKETNITQGMFYSCQWFESVLDNVTFMACRFVQCCFSYTQLKQVNFIECEFEDCCFEEVDIDNINFVMNKKLHLLLTHCRGEIITVVDNQQLALRMEDSHLSKCVLVKFDFAQLQLKNTSLPHLVVLESQAQGYDFSDMSLVFCQFTGSQLQQSKFSRSDVSQGSFMNCQLEGADFRQARLYQTLFMKSVLKQADLRESYAELANFSEADCQGALFDDSHLMMAQMQKAQLQQASLQRCLMHFTDFSYADMSGADCREGEFMRSPHHATIHDKTRFTHKIGILPTDEQQLKADQWLLSH